jgi:hypothetical protein
MRKLKCGMRTDTDREFNRGNAEGAKSRVEASARIDQLWIVKSL